MSSTHCVGSQVVIFFFFFSFFSSFSPFRWAWLFYSTSSSWPRHRHADFCFALYFLRLFSVWNTMNPWIQWDEWLQSAVISQQNRITDNISVPNWQRLTDCIVIIDCCYRQSDRSGRRSSTKSRAELCLRTPLIRCCLSLPRQVRQTVEPKQKQREEWKRQSYKGQPVWYHQGGHESFVCLKQIFVRKGLLLTKTRQGK